MYIYIHMYIYKYIYIYISPNYIGFRFHWLKHPAHVNARIPSPHVRPHRIRGCRTREGRTGVCEQKRTPTEKKVRGRISFRGAESGAFCWRIAGQRLP